MERRSRRLQRTEYRNEFYNSGVPENQGIVKINIRTKESFLVAYSRTYVA